MTSTISSKNKNFARLFKWAFRRNRTILIIFSILMAVGIALDLYVLTMSSAFSSPSTDLTYQFGIIGYASIIIAQIGAIFFAIISASHTFAFLHNKRSTDMFGAIPATRSTLYFSHLLGGMISVMIPFAAGSLIVMGFTCRGLDYLLADISFILFGLLGIAAVYSFATLIAYCCGTALDSNIIVFVENLVYFGAVAIFWGMATAMIPGCSFDNIFNTPIITLLSPIGFCGFFDAYYLDKQTSAMWITVVWTLIFTAAMVLLGNIAAKKRRAETAQNEFNIKWLPVVIKVGTSVLCGGFIGMAAASAQYSGFSNMFTFCFWYLIIGFAAFFILHLIFSRGMKGRFLPSLIAYFCTTAAVIGFVFALTTGLGIDTYVPAAANVSSVTLSDSKLVFYESENIETVSQIHRLLIEGVQKENPRPYYLGQEDISMVNNYSESYEAESAYDHFNKQYPLINRTNFSFHYNKKLGFATDRDYRISYYRARYYNCDEIEALLRKLYNSEEYKKISQRDLWESDSARRNNMLPTEAELSYCTYSASEYYGSHYTDVTDESLKTDEAFIEGLYQAVKKDILADQEYYYKVSNSYYDYSTPVLGQKYLKLSIQYNPDDVLSPALYDSYTYRHITSIELIITEDYTNTLNYLENSGISMTMYDLL